jgi:DNA-binding HxlR family transcriptional regulator
MLGRTYEKQNCSAARALEIIGERWSLLIIRDALFRGARRFGDFQRSLGLARNILAARLERFVDEGLLRRQPHGGPSPYHDYVLTEKGRELHHVVIALTHWGDRWAAPGGPPVVFRHADCGGEVRLHARCEDCHRDVPAVDIEPDPQADAQGYRADRPA